MACNTVSSSALAEIRLISGVPVMGVIEPGVKEALKGGAARRVLVIGTSATVSSRAYSRALRKKDRRVFVAEKACPLFVPLAEEGWCSGRVAASAAEKYLGPQKKRGFDTMILGCTHYPLLKKIISAELGRGVRIVDSALATARSAKAELETRGLMRGTKTEASAGGSKRSGKKPGGKGQSRFIVSDAPEKFRTLASKLLNIRAGKVVVKRF